MSLLKICKTRKEVKELIGYIQETRYMSFDFETSGLKYHEDFEYPTIISISFQPGSAWVIPLGHYQSKFKDNWVEILLMLKGVLEDYTIVKVAQNLKFEYKWLLRFGISCKGVLFDTMLAKYCLDEEKPHGLKEMVQKFFPAYAHYEDQVQPLVKKYGWARVPLPDLCKYGGIDADLTLRIMIFLEAKLIKLGFYNLFRNLLMMMTRVLGESEFEGMLVDRPYLESLMVKYQALIRDENLKLAKNHTVLKFEKRIKREKIKALIESIKTEIEEIKAKPKYNPVLIRNREKKIEDILSGKYNGKEMPKPFNFASPKQLIELFFKSKHGFRFKVVRYTTDKFKKPTKNPSTDESVLQELKDKDGSGFIDSLLELRGLEKLYGTYVKGMLAQLTNKDRVHANFHLLTVTGRLGCKEPNLQNIPRVLTGGDIKPMFIPPPGMLLGEVDYSQAELRVVAELAKDEAMIEIFRKDYNIHVATACLMNGGINLYDKVKGILKDEEHEENEFWERAKKKAKTINFGILYEQGPDKLGEGLGCSKDEAKEFKEIWLNNYPGVRKWIDNQHKHATEHGYVRNLFGRKRRLPDAMFRDWNEAKRYNMVGKWLEAQRQSVNAPIQGTASDFTSFSEVVIREHNKLGLLPYNMQQAYTVHDSIGFYIYPKDIHWVIPKLVTICDNPQTQKYFGFELKEVKMKVSPEIGVNWGSLHSYDPWQNYEKWVSK